jgi:thioredoxin reductase
MATFTGSGGAPTAVVGGGIAGGNAAVGLREQGFEGPVVLVGREPGVRLAALSCRTRTCARRKRSTGGT